ncbi:MAG: divergent PAP2 family protein [Candidatus Krumholzibacteriia bacterium]|nr:divergent PAP2 family protein [Candidatus Latescibacterota bacterium]
MLLAPIIGTGLLGQLLKLGFHSLRERRWRPGRLADFESFPSLHPLLGGCLAVQVAQATGWGSPYTAIVLGYTAVILYDTSGVKRAAGRQAGILMSLGQAQSLEHRLSVLLGQSPVRAWVALLAGGMLGLLVERALLALRAWRW